MPNAPGQRFTDHMRVLFGAGTCAGLTDGQLLERFLASRDEAGELAFEALVTQHGPMVMRVCRNVLDDPHDVHDAFQAVFMVLARRAHAIRHRESVASWLYGVAVRVSARARVTAIRRRIHDRRTNAAAEIRAAAMTNQHGPVLTDRHDQAEVVHQELSRLPERYRAPVVLCYLEGLTHDEAAARLNCPVGTVRSRLARARDRLRTRLTRRGVMAPGAMGAMASWIMRDNPASAAVVASLSSEVISRELAASIARTISRVPVGQTVAAVAGPSGSLVLAHGVFKMMIFKKLLLATCTLMPITMAIVGGGVFLARGSLARTQNHPAAAPARSVPQTKTKEPLRSDDIEILAERLLDAAHKRYEAQKTYYEEGRITIDRFVDASKQLELAELRLAKTDSDRLAIRRRHVNRINEIEKREKAELEVGRGTVADLAEAYHRHLEAELELRLSQREAAEMATLLRRLGELERKVEQLEKKQAER